ncbi:hypothetical protein [Streptomyces sp. NPDC056255]
MAPVAVQGVAAAMGVDLGCWIPSTSLTYTRTMRPGTVCATGHQQR